MGDANPTESDEIVAESLTSAASKVWENMEVRETILRQYLNAENGFDVLLLNRLHLKESTSIMYNTVGMSWYRKLLEKEIPPLRRFDYLSLVQHLDITACLPALLNCPDVIHLFSLFPNLSSVTGYRFTIERKRNPDSSENIFVSHRTIETISAMRLLEGDDPYQSFWEQTLDGISFSTDQGGNSNFEWDMDKVIVAIEERKFPFNKSMKGLSLENLWKLTRPLDGDIRHFISQMNLVAASVAITLRSFNSEEDIIDLLKDCRGAVTSLTIRGYGSIVSRLLQTDWREFNKLQNLNIDGVFAQTWLEDWEPQKSSVWHLVYGPPATTFKFKSITLTIRAIDSQDLLETCFTIGASLRFLASTLCSLGGFGCKYTIKLFNSKVKENTKEGVNISQLGNEFTRRLSQEIFSLQVERNGSPGWRQMIKGENGSAVTDEGLSADRLNRFSRIVG